MQTYVLTLDCETCGSTMRHRVGDLTSDPGDEVQINLVMAVSQITFECGSCGGVTYTGDFEDMCEHEPGDEGELSPREDDHEETL